MNFLAHLALSGNSEEILVGNFIADFLRGKQFGDLDPAIVRGIKLHRMIDTFTDQHPLFLSSKRKFSAYRHYAPVLVDVFYDHILAVQWNRFFPLDRAQFIQESYDVLLEHQDRVPENAAKMIGHMIRKNWISGYHTIEGIQRVLDGMSQRTSFPSRMEEAMTDYHAHKEVLAEEFEDFFPDVQEECRKFLANV